MFLGRGQTFFPRVCLFPPPPSQASQAPGFETNLFHLKTILLNLSLKHDRIHTPEANPTDMQTLTKSKSRDITRVHQTRFTAATGMCFRAATGALSSYRRLALNQTNASFLTGRGSKQNSSMTGSSVRWAASFGKPNLSLQFSIF